MSAELTKSTTSFGDAADPYQEDCKLIPFLKTLVNRQILYIRNHGTAGDALIEEGTFELFRKLGLTWDVCCEHVNKNTELDVVMYAGGGNLVPQFNHAKMALEKWIPRSRALVLLSHSVEGHEGFLQSLPSHVYIFCRELSSLAYVKSKHPFPQNVQFGRDMSFFYPYAAMLTHLNHQKPAAATAGTLSYMFSFRCAEVELRINDLCEKTCELGINRDLLEEHHIGPRNSLERAKAVSYWLLTEIDKADFIITDRLHLAIAAFMIGKTVFIQHSAIHKIDEIISSSLTRFPEFDRRVFLMGDTSFSQLSMRFQKNFVAAKEANAVAHFMGSEPARPSKCPNKQGPTPVQGGGKRKPKPSPDFVRADEVDPVAQQQLKMQKRRERVAHVPPPEPEPEPIPFQQAPKPKKVVKQPQPKIVEYIPRHQGGAQEGDNSNHGMTSYRVGDMDNVEEAKSITIDLAPKPPIPPDFDGNPPPPPKKKKPRPSEAVFRDNAVPAEVAPEVQVEATVETRPISADVVSEEDLVVGNPRPIKGKRRSRTDGVPDGISDMAGGAPARRGKRGRSSGSRADTLASNSGS